MTGRRGQGSGAFSEPFGMLTPQHGLAMQAQRRMYETGTTSRQFGMVAVTERAHANRNPDPQAPFGIFGGIRMFLELDNILGGDQPDHMVFLIY